LLQTLSLQVIEELRTVEEAVELAARADVIAKIAKKIHRGLTVQNQCAAIKLRAERRAGARY
jgi:hypothetical protein